jgi:hypothetical protein
LASASVLAVQASVLASLAGVLLEPMLALLGQRVSSA